MKSYNDIMLNAVPAPSPAMPNAWRLDHTSILGDKIKLLAHGQSIPSVAVAVSGARSISGAMCFTWLRCGIPSRPERASLAAPFISVAP